MINRYFILTFILIACTLGCVQGQTTDNQVQYALEALAPDVPGLEQPVDFSASNMPLSAFLRTLGNTNHINMSLGQGLDFPITNNFYKINALNVLTFLASQYQLQIKTSGSIIIITKKEQPLQPVVPKLLKVQIDSSGLFLNMELSNDSLAKVTTEMTRLSGKNIVLAPEVRARLVNGFITKDTLGGALEKLCLSNNLELQLRDGFYMIIDPKTQPQPAASVGSGNSSNINRPQAIQGKGDFSLKALSPDDITLNAVNIPLSDIIKEVSRALKINYFIFTDIKENVTASFTKVSYETILERVLKGTKYGFRKTNGIYLFADKESENLRQTKILQLKYRSVLDLSKQIPEKIKNGLVVQEMVDMNSLLICGPSGNVDDLVGFIHEIDQVVPVVMIEVMIVDAQNSYSVETGIKGGLGTAPTPTTGQAYPTPDMSLGAGSVNSLINLLNGTGLLKLGKVTSNFYLNVKALEEQGIVKVRSTPRLATLNGHEASLKLGSTEYYVEQTSQIYANQTTTQTTQRQFKSVTADFTLTITPVVSGDEQITLNIVVDQNDFTGVKVAVDAPPNQISRKFSSLIRVKNEEMILLGGLEEKNNSNSGSGIPWFSRVPVLKWLTSSRKKADATKKLNIFIKPIIMY